MQQFGDSGSVEVRAAEVRDLFDEMSILCRGSWQFKLQQFGDVSCRSLGMVAVKGNVLLINTQPVR